MQGRDPHRDVYEKREAEQGAAYQAILHVREVAQGPHPLHDQHGLLAVVVAGLQHDGHDATGQVQVHLGHSTAWQSERGGTPELLERKLLHPLLLNLSWCRAWLSRAMMDLAIYSREEAR